MEPYSKETEGGTYFLITSGVCIASWKNTKTDYFIPMVVYFLVFPSLSEIAHSVEMAQKAEQAGDKFVSALQMLLMKTLWLKAIPNSAKTSMEHQISMDGGASREKSSLRWDCIKSWMHLRCYCCVFLWLICKKDTVSILDTLVKRFDGTETKHRESSFNLQVYKWEEGLCSWFLFTVSKSLSNKHLYSQFVYNLMADFVYSSHV